ncbi:MAG TPA: bifunctional glutamate N-acetyltransferase/amino-acid acetyltransferase ArgJ [Candidatus Angelobacter sp.]|nr:bifunctional glutamate N-acetyltransferase/amino-acid acetyltransferase ArgJ [Candidatus Angelobacter sp.]
MTADLSAPSPPPADVARSGVCAARGFVAGVAAAGIRGDGDDRRLDVAVVRSERPCDAAGVFTRNVFRAAPVSVSQLHLETGGIHAVVLNSGNANACTGAQGMRDALAMCRAAGDAESVELDRILVCSTGVIGRPLPLERVLAGVRTASTTASHDGGDAAARAIMTTDTVPKQAVSGFRANGRRYTVGGMAKGSGMIHPDMATLLALVTTDAPVARALLQPLLQRVADQTFNCVTVDGDTSTNDTLLLLANGVAGGTPFAAGSAALAALEGAVFEVCQRLTEMVAADGEGATRYFRVDVRGAADPAAARVAARTVAASPLVKTAVHGGDPNWGRVLAALGRSGVALDPQRCRLFVSGVAVYAGAPVAVDALALHEAFAGQGAVIGVDLAAGDCEGQAWGCDMGPGYVTVNAHYAT